MRQAPTNWGEFLLLARESPTQFGVEFFPKFWVLFTYMDHRLKIRFLGRLVPAVNSVAKIQSDSATKSVSTV